MGTQQAVGPLFDLAIRGNVDHGKVMWRRDLAAELLDGRLGAAATQDRVSKSDNHSTMAFPKPRVTPVISTIFFPIVGLNMPAGGCRVQTSFSARSTPNPGLNGA